MQSKVKLVKIPEGVIPDSYFGDDDDVNLDTGDLINKDRDIDRGNSKEKAIVIIDLPYSPETEDIDFFELM